MRLLRRCRRPCSQKEMENTSRTTAVCARYRAERSANGVSLTVLKSALQKYIRRGLVDKALWCAGELVSFREAPEKDGRGRVQTNFRHRLMIITLEDVGLGAPEVWPAAQAWEQTFRTFQEHPREADAAIGAWVAALAGAPKSRACSHYKAVCCPERGASRAVANRLYPSVAAIHARFDQDARACDKTRWVEAFEGALAERDPTAGIWGRCIAAKGERKRVYGRTKPVWQVFKALEKVVPARYHQMAMAWYKDLESCKESYLCWFALVLAHVLGTAWPAWPDRPGQNDSSEAPEGAWKAGRAAPIELDSYVFDIHTGARTGVVKFALEGAWVANENAAVTNAVWKRFYEDLKRHAEGVALCGPDEEKTVLPLESAAYDFVVRAQLTTSQAKTDVYFATGATGELYVVKGPLRKIEDARRAIQMAAWKAANGLPAVEPRLVFLCPDRWPDGVPLGIRNGLDRARPAPFLVAKSLTPLAAIRRRVHSSKLWPPTEVVDPAATSHHFSLKAFAAGRLSGEENADYVLALLARYVFGVSDLAERNFIRAKGRVYSVDEETRKPELYFERELGCRRVESVAAWIDGNWETVRSSVSGWTQVPQRRHSFWKTVCDRAQVLRLFGRGKKAN